VAGISKEFREGIKYMKKIKSIMFFQNGNTAVFDKNGEQVPELQKGWLLMFIEFLQSKNIKVENIDEIILPTGGKVKYLKKYHNYEIK